MTNDSYSRGRTSGISDGTTEGLRGADDYRASQRHLERTNQLWGRPQAGMGDEGRRLGEGLMAIVGALFLHRYFCFVGFWLIGFGLLMALPPALGLSDADLNGLPAWYGYTAAAVPVVLAVPLRKIIPTMMRWIFYAALAAFVIGLIVAVVKSR
jgi:hypothetical protein